MRVVIGIIVVASVAAVAVIAIIFDIVSRFIVFTFIMGAIYLILFIIATIIFNQK